MSASRGLRGLRVRLQLVVLLAVLPALALILNSGRRAEQDAQGEAGLAALRLASAAAVQGNQILSDTRPYLELLAQHPVVRGSDAAAQTALFKDLLRDDSRYHNIGLIGTDGFLRASAVAFKAPMDLSDRVYYRRVRASESVAIGEFVIGRVTGKHQANMGAPVRDAAGAVTGVVYVAIHLDFLDRLPAQANVPRDTFVALLDAHGKVLMRLPDDPQGLVGRAVPDEPLVRAVLAGAEDDERHAVVPGFDGVPRPYAWAPLRFETEPTGGYLVVGIRPDEAVAKAESETERNVLVLAIAAALAAAVAWIAGDLLVVRRARTLVNVTVRISAGDLAARAGPAYGGGEMGELARSIDAMAESLARREAELRRAEERYRSLVERTPAVFYAAGADAGDRVVFVGPDAGRLLGFEAATWTADPQLWRNRLHPADRARVLAEMERCVTAGGSFLVEYRLVAQDGGTVWIRDSGIVRDDAGGTTPRVTGFLVDATEAKALHEQALRVQQLEAAARLATGVAGDIDGSLAAIERRARAVLGKLADDPVLRDHVDGILRASARAADVSRRLRAFGGGGDVAPELLDVNRVIEGLLPAVRAAAGPRIDVDSLLAPAIGLVSADPARFAECVSRLAARGCESMKDGGRLVIGTAEVDVAEDSPTRPPGARPGAYVLVGVSDDGPALDADAAADAFAPYPSAAAQTHHPDADLAPVFGFARASGGFVEVASAPGKGTTYKLLLPCDRHV